MVNWGLTSELRVGILFCNYFMMIDPNPPSWYSRKRFSVFWAADIVTFSAPVSCHHQWQCLDWGNGIPSQWSPIRQKFHCQVYVLSSNWSHWDFIPEPFLIILIKNGDMVSSNKRDIHQGWSRAKEHGWVRMVMAINHVLHHGKRQVRQSWDMWLGIHPAPQTWGV